MADAIADFNAAIDNRARLASGIAGVDAELPPLGVDPAPVPDPVVVAPVAETETTESDTDDDENVTESGGEFLRRQRGRIATALSYSENRARSVYDRVAAAPTPGGSGALLTAIILILFAAVPVSKQGKTRLQLIWDTVGGRTSLEGKRLPSLKSIGLPSVVGSNTADVVIADTLLPVPAGDALDTSLVDLDEL